MIDLHPFTSTDEYELPAEDKARWVELLWARDEADHITSMYWNQDHTKFCAVGLFLEDQGYKNRELYLDSLSTADSANCRSTFVKVALLNDVDQLSFSEIADWIEENVEIV